ncbi:phosphate acetyltransferase [Hydrogenimonas sp.]
MQSIFVMSKESGAGTFFVSLGLMEILKRSYKRVAFFKPIVRQEKKEVKESDIETMLSIFKMGQLYETAVGVTLKETEDMLASGKEKELYEAIIERYEALRRRYDFVLCAGVTDAYLKELVDFDLNIQIAKNLSSSIVGVLNGRDKSAETIGKETALWSSSLKDEGVQPIAFFINRVMDNPSCPVSGLRKDITGIPCFPIPYNEKLDKPTIFDLLAAMKGTVLHMRDERNLERVINDPVIAAMHPEHFLSYFKEQDLVIVPADRADIFMTILSSNHIPGFPTASAVVVGGETEVPTQVLSMIEADDTFGVVLIRVPLDTMQIAQIAQHIEAKITSKQIRKIQIALGHFSAYVDTQLLEQSLQKKEPDILTPAMFLYRIFAKASSVKKRIVLPESEDDRILRAAETIIHRGIAEIVLLGDEQKVRNRAGMLGVDIEDAKIVNHIESEKKDRFAQLFYELRKSKGVNLEMAKDLMQNPTYFATMMVYTGMADGMVSGATHTTRETVLPALQIIKTKPGVDIVSSLFFMCLETRVLVYGDCAIVPDPTPEELAQIAIESAQTAKTFGIEPIVAMLSYSTGDSGVGEDVEKVRKATKLAQKMRPDILIEGPMQYDAAIDPQVAKRKMPGSRVAGRATVFIFPDLNTGNTTYKAVQRSTGAIAIGPVLQGLKKAVNDLSRGCSVDDIVSTVAITAVQAHQLEEESK